MVDRLKIIIIDRLIITFFFFWVQVPLLIVLIKCFKRFKLDNQRKIYIIF